MAELRRMVTFALDAAAALEKTDPYDGASAVASLDGDKTTRPQKATKNRGVEVVVRLESKGGTVDS